LSPGLAPVPGTGEDRDVSDVATPQPTGHEPTAGWAGGRRPGTEIVVVVVVVVLVLVALLLRVLLDDDADHRVAVDRGGRDAAVLIVASGADSITVRADDVGGDLAVVTTPEGSRARPVADLDDDTLTVRTADVRADDNGDDNDNGDDGDGDGGPVDLVVRVSRDVRWDVVVGGGSQRLTVDLRGTTTGRVEVRGGQGSIDLTLPEPDGLLAAVVAGGAGTVTVHAPEGVPVRVDLDAGAGSAALDGDHRQGLAAGSSLTSPDWTGTGDRIEVECTSGVGTLTLDRS
jgi:hypothetical protein